MTVDHGPSRLSGGFALAMGVLATIPGAAAGSGGISLSLAGLLVLGGGLLRGSRSLVTLGATGLLCGALVAGLAAGGPASVLLAVTATTLAWDAGQFAIGVGSQLSREATTVRLELVHAAGSTVAGVTTVMLGYVGFLASDSGQPLSGVILLVAAVVVLLVALRRFRVGRRVAAD